MKLQIALDEFTVEQGLELCEKTRSFIDIIEIGTPFLVREGLHAVRVFREHFPEKEILVDAKIMDAGEWEAGACFEAGADYVTVLAVTDMLTVKSCVETAEKYGGKIVADMICVQDVEKRVRELEDAGIMDIAAHTGVDRQTAGRTPLEDLIQIKQYAKRSHISVAGGIGSDTVEQYISAGADVMIVGGGIAHAADPEKEAGLIAEKLRRPQEGQMERPAVTGAGDECKYMEIILKELKRYGAKVRQEEVRRLAEACVRAKRVFTGGAGRSGFAARAFANRLAHLGLTAYFIGEPTTPPVREGDLLVAGSGSGTTESLAVNVKKAKAAGATVAAVTIFPDAQIGRLADIVVTVPGATPKKGGGAKDCAISAQPMGSLFEQLSWLVYDSTVLELMELTGENGDTMYKRHANLE